MADPRCFIYKSLRKADAYLYVVEAGRADLEGRKAHRDSLEPVEVEDLEIDAGGVVLGEQADAADEIGDEGLIGDLQRELAHVL